MAAANLQHMIKAGLDGFCQKAIEKYNNPDSEPFTISGNGKQVRDILHADDIIALYFSALDKIEKIKGNAFNIGGTNDQSLSLLELFKLLEDVGNKNGIHTITCKGK